MTYEEFKAWLFLMGFSKRRDLPDSDAHQLTHKLKKISVYTYDKNKNISVYLTSGKRLPKHTPDEYKKMIEKELLYEKST